MKALSDLSGIVLSIWLCCYVAYSIMYGEMHNVFF